MPKNYWMVVQTPENFEISKELGFTVHGLKSRNRRRAQRMEPDDRILFYVEGIRKWTAITSITSRYFEDRTPIWKSKSRGDELPYRVKMAPSIVLNEKDYIDALELAPRLEYLKRWAPEHWPPGVRGHPAPAAPERLQANRRRDEADPTQGPDQGTKRWKAQARR